MEVQLSKFTRLTNLIKYCHWSTNSYQQHKTLDDLYDSISEQVDLFVESYLGKLSDRKIIINEDPIIVKTDLTEVNIPGIIKSEGQGFVKFLRDTSGEDSSLNSIVDNVEAELNKAQYLFRLK